MGKKRSLFEIHTAVLLFGLAGLFGKLIPLSSSMIVLGRVFFASISLALIIFISKQKIKIRFWKDLIYFLLLGALLSSHWISFFTSIQVSTVAIGLLSFSCYPILTVFLESLIFREKLIKLNIFYATLCFSGISILIEGFNLSNSSFQGIAWGVLSGITFSFLIIFNKKLAQRYSSFSIAFFQDLFAFLILSPLAACNSASWSLRSIFLLFILGVFCTAGAHTLFIEGIRQIKAQTASIINSLEPVYGIIMAYFFLREIPSLRTIFGGVVVLIAVLGATLSSRKGLSSIASRQN